MDALLLAFLGSGSADTLLDPGAGVPRVGDLVEAFWREVALRFGYASDAPTLRDFVTTLFRWANPLDSAAPKLDAHARVFLQRWKDSQACMARHSASGPATLEDDLHVVSSAQRAGRPRGRCRLRTPSRRSRSSSSIGSAGDSRRGVPDAVLRATIEGRRGSFWFPEHEDGYEALTQAIDLREMVEAAELQVESVDAGIARYLASWHRLDTAYRRFCCHQRRYGQVALTERRHRVGGEDLRQQLPAPAGRPVERPSARDGRVGMRGAARAGRLLPPFRAALPGPRPEGVRGGIGRLPVRGGG